MSTLELFGLLERRSWYVTGYALLLPMLVLVLRLLHGSFRAAHSPWRYCYSIIVYLSCIPGVFVAFAGLYLAVFTRENALTLNLVVYAFPVVSMILTLTFIRRTIRFDDIPGFKRIAGLIAITVATFVVLLVLDRLRILLFFRASILWFFLIGVGLFLAFKLGGRLLFGRSNR